MSWRCAALVSRNYQLDSLTVKRQVLGMTPDLRNRNRGCALVIIMLNLSIVATVCSLATQQYWGLGKWAASGVWVCGAAISFLPIVRSVVLFLALLVTFQWWQSLLIVLAVGVLNAMKTDALKNS